MTVSSKPLLMDTEIGFYTIFMCYGMFFFLFGVPPPLFIIMETFLSFMGFTKADGRLFDP